MNEFKGELHEKNENLCKYRGIMSYISEIVQISSTFTQILFFSWISPLNVSFMFQSIKSVQFKSVQFNIFEYLTLDVQVCTCVQYTQNVQNFKIDLETTWSLAFMRTLIFHIICETFQQELLIL